LSATPHPVERLAPSPEEILATVTTLLDQVIGQDYELDVDITFETSFADDVELESIEFVRLSELLQERYGTAVNFVDWFSGLTVEQIIALTVGELVAFIHGEVGGSPGA
jgi:acyl carrier protein